MIYILNNNQYLVHQKITSKIFKLLNMIQHLVNGIFFKIILLMYIHLFEIFLRRKN